MLHDLRLSRLGDSDGRVIATRNAPRLLEAETRELEVVVLREVVDPVDLSTDVRNCLVYLWSEAGVDRNRIGIWGTSYGGGHAVVTAGHDDRIRAVVAQIGGFGFPPAYKDWARDQAAKKVRGEIDPVVPQNGLNGVPGLKGTPDIGRQVEHSQLAAAARVHVPTLIIDAEFEELNNRLEHGWAAYMMMRQNAPAEYQTYPCKHYAVYDEYFAASTDRALAWFESIFDTQDDVMTNQADPAAHITEAIAKAQVIDDVPADTPLLTIAKVASSAPVRWAAGSR